MVYTHVEIRFQPDRQYLNEQKSQKKKKFKDSQKEVDKQ